MRPIGYLYKHVATCPEWLAVQNVDDIFALSGCLSRNFADYINYWRHNGFWLFDSPEIMRELAAEHVLSLDGLQLFYYEAHEAEYNDKTEQWQPYAPEASFQTHVTIPASSRLEGFDVTTFSVHTSPECSPLSCNGLAAEIPTNRHCLFQTLDEAHSAIERGAFKNSEPGPFRIVAVHSVIDSLSATFQRDANGKSR